LNRKRDPGFWLLAIYLAVYALSVVLFFVTSRYRLPVLPALYPLSAWFLSEGWRQVLGLKRSLGILFACGFLIIVWMVFRPFSISNPSFSHWKIGVAFQRDGKFDEAIKYFHKASILDPDNDRAPLHLGLIYLEQGKEEKALEEFERVIQKNPESIEALFRAATIYFVNRNLDKAEWAYRRALTLNSNVPEGHFNLAMIYLERELLNRAFFELRTVLRLDPKYSEAHFNIAGIYLLKNKFDLAQYHYFQAAHLGYPVDQTIFKRMEDLRNDPSANSDAG